jgi:hypothetical protein
VCEIEIERMSEESQMHVMIGAGWRTRGREIRDLVIDYIKKANEIRRRYT